MKKLEKAKEIYKNIETPKSLNNMINDMVEKNKPKNNFKYAYSAVAGLALFVLVGVNISETFAINFSKIPLIGNVVSIVSRYRQKIDEDKTVNTETPQIIAKNKDVEDKAEKLNKEIQNIIEEYTKEAEKNIEEYKSAFIQTGGTEEEFKAKNIVVDVSYDVKSESANHLSMILNANENWVNAHNVSYFYNINLNTGENISLKIF